MIKTGTQTYESQNKIVFAVCPQQCKTQNLKKKLIPIPTHIKFYQLNHFCRPIKYF